MSLVTKKDYWVVFTYYCDDPNGKVSLHDVEDLRHRLYRTFARSESFLMKSNFFTNLKQSKAMFYCVVSDRKLAERIEIRMSHMIKDGVVGGEAQHASNLKDVRHLVRRQKRFFRYNLK